MRAIWYWRVAAWSCVPASVAALFVLTGNPWALLAALSLAVAGAVHGLWLPAVAALVSGVHVWLAWVPVLFDPRLADAPGGESLRQAGQSAVAFSPEGLLMLAVVLAAIVGALALRRRLRARAGV